MACGLAVAGEQLYVSTDLGIIYCFGSPGAQTPSGPERGAEIPLPETDSKYSKTAANILQRLDISDGVCVDLGCGAGDLTLELAKKTDLDILSVDSDREHVRQLRERLDRAGLYGTRVTVHQFNVSDVPYADFCADLVVSGRSVTAKPDAGWHKTARRLRRPCGGILCFGSSDNLNVDIRGPLDGAADWTHQNTSPANVLCSDDRRVRGGLEMLWYRDTDFLMVNRHGRAPTALVQNGRMFVEGLNGVRAQSIYNGSLLWEFQRTGILAAYNREHSIGAAWTGGNMCLGPQRVYVHDSEACFVLDAATGKRLPRWEPPRHPDGQPGKWGYIACDNGMLYGSLANEDYLVKCWSDRWDTSNQFTESLLLFALDAQTGRRKWTYKAKDSIRHNAIAIGGGRVYLVDRPVAIEDDLKYSPPARSAEVRRGAKKRDSGQPEEPEEAVHRPGRLVALDQMSGERVWSSEGDGFGTLLMYAAEDDLLWMGYQAAHQASRASERANRMAVFDATNGVKRWDIRADYADRPILNGRTIYAAPGAWDLLTGSRLPFDLKRSYGCGTIAGCREMLLFRSATLGYIDLGHSSETQNYGGVRPGCWIAAIPAGGVVTMPDAASWCTCSYLNQGTLVLQPVTKSGGNDHRRRQIENEPVHR
jgi:outer membrane protein assembly factor BamB